MTEPAGRQDYGGDLKGRWILTDGLGGWESPSLWLAQWREPR